MENVFDSLRSYAGNWVPVSTRKFNDAEINAIAKAEVVHTINADGTDYGKSVMFLMKSGVKKYIGVGQNSQSKVTVGQPVDLSTATYVKLERDGQICHKIEL